MSRSGVLWLVVIAFFGCAAVATVILRRLISTQRLAEEIGFFVALLGLYLAVKLFVRVDATYVNDLIAGSALYLTQLLLSLVMMKSLAIGLAVVLFVIVRHLVLKQFRNVSVDDHSGSQGGRFASILFQSLLPGAVAFVISELVLRLWSAWQGG
ncbi:MAG TPA: hypothetical protein VE135_22815 [Pyrinomonadaceae bacterium]|nr:hypothetical protein [Pyrinomonadaceae bacterium]